MRLALNLTLKYITAILLLLLIAMPVLAQSYNDNYDPARSNVTFTPPGTSPPQGVPPPPGDGGANNVATVTPGDQPGTNPPVPTGTPTTGNPGPAQGTYFQHESQTFRSRVNLLVSRGQQTVNGVSVNRGTRVALTFQPDQLTDSQQSQIAGSLKLSSADDLFTNEPYQNITVSTATLEQIQKVLYPPPPPSGSIYPYPGTPKVGDTIRNTPWTSRSFIAVDMKAPGYPRYASQPLPTVNGQPLLKQGIRDFALYLVILGVVVACIQIVFAGAFMAFGHQYAGAKAVAAASGLMLLLMAFTIWKVDIFNILQARGQPQSANDPDSFDVRHPPINAFIQVTGSHTYNGDMTLPQDQKSDTDQSNIGHPEANLPAIPAPDSGQVEPRSGLPLSPLGAAH